MNAGTKSMPDRLSDAAGEALKLIERVNARHEAITGTGLFKTTPEYAAAMARLSEPCSDMGSFAVFIEAVHLFFYRGSGDGTRIMAFAALPDFISDVRILRSVKEDSQKLSGADKIFEKYGGRRPEDCGAEDFQLMQITILDKISEFLAFLMR